MGRVRKKLLPTVRKPTNEENCDLMKKLAKMPGKPAAALLLEDNCCEYLPPALEVKLPKPLTSMFQKDAIGLSLPELLTKSRELFQTIHITKEQSEAICSLTASQTSSKHWFTYNSFRITASKFRQVLHSNLVFPSISICYPEAFQFTSEATRYFILLLRILSITKTIFLFL
jgi:hypothetical protein